MRRDWQLKVDTYLGRKNLQLCALSQARKYYRNHLQLHFTIERTNTTDDNTSKIDFRKYLWVFRTHAIHGLHILAERTVVLPIADGRYAAAVGRGSRVPVSLSSECPVCERWARKFAVGVVFAEISLINWLSNRARCEICQLGVPKYARTLSSIRSGGTG